jgi:heavy metal sensor kinase
MLERLGELRTRLTLWYTTLLAGLLLVLGVAAFTLLDRGLRANVDASLRSVAVTIAESSRQTARSGTSLERMLDAFLGPGAGGLFALLDPRGRPDPRLAPRSGDRLPLSTSALRNAEHGQETFESIALPGARAPIRLLTWPVTSGDRLEQLVQVAASLDAVEAARRRFLLILLGLTPVALAGAAAGGWWLAGRALAPVDRITATARRITAEDLARRIDPPGTSDEIGRLVAVLNDMLARLDAAFATARQFSADAAHELRTPLTILKGELEVGLAAAPEGDEPHRVMASCLEEVDRLIALVESLLFLARADAGVAENPHDPVDLAELLGDAQPAMQALADRAGVALVLHPADGLVVRGSAPQLLRVLLNLTDNAIKYAPRGGRIDVAIRPDGDRAVLEVKDTGPGIAPEDERRIFERFYRGDPAHGRGGTGLGLALVRSIVRMHGGEVTVDSRPGAGSRFVVTLPRAAGAA